MNSNNAMRDFLTQEAQSKGSGTRDAGRARRLLAAQHPAPCARQGVPQPAPGVQPRRRCRDCGCTNDNGCQTPFGPCWWVEADLCSGCI